MEDIRQINFEIEMETGDLSMIVEKNDYFADDLSMIREEVEKSDWYRKILTFTLSFRLLIVSKTEFDVYVRFDFELSS